MWLTRTRLLWLKNCNWIRNKLNNFSLKIVVWPQLRTVSVSIICYDCGKMFIFLDPLPLPLFQWSSIVSIEKSGKHCNLGFASEEAWTVNTFITVMEPLLHITRFVKYINDIVMDGAGGNLQPTPDLHLTPHSFPRLSRSGFSLLDCVTCLHSILIAANIRTVFYQMSWSIVFFFFLK